MVLICASDCEESWPGLQQKQFRIAQHGGQRVVHAVFHVRHVTAQRGEVLDFLRLPARLASRSCAASTRRNDSPATSNSVCDQSSLCGTCRKSRVADCADHRIHGNPSATHTITAVAGSSERKYFVRLPLTDRSNDHKIVGVASLLRHSLLFRTVTSGSFALRLPTPGHNPGKLRFIGENQNAGVRQSPSHSRG